MAATRMDMTVHYEDGTTDQVAADQRDIVVFERVEKHGFIKALDDMPITLFRFLAFQALQRTGSLPKTAVRAEWEARVIEVELDDDEVTADPGQPEAPDDSSSNSQLRRSRASGKSANGGSPRT